MNPNGREPKFWAMLKDYELKRYVLGAFLASLSASAYLAASTVALDHDNGNYSLKEGNGVIAVRGWAKPPPKLGPGFNIYISRISGRDYTRANLKPISTLSIVIHGVKPGKRYYFVLTNLAYTAQGLIESKPSQEFSMVAGSPLAGGNAGAVDFIAAREGYERAAQAGDASAYGMLGNLYRDGLGVPRSLKRASEFYKKGAQGGDAYSQMTYADFIVDGFTNEDDTSQATFWAGKAAERRFPGSEECLLRAQRNANSQGASSKLPRKLRLVAASEEGDLAHVKRLVEAGADVNAPDKRGVTALELASNRGHREIVQYLLNLRASVNATDDDGATPLIEAIYKGYLDIAEDLVNAGADINMLKKNSLSALCFASSTPGAQVARWALAHGADIHQGYPPINCAAGDGNDEVVELFARLGGFSGEDMKHPAALIAAIEGEHNSTVALLLKLGAKPNAQDAVGISPLMRAASFGYEGIVKCLLEAGADPRQSDDSGATALQMAKENQHAAVVSMLEDAQGL
jgi:ankyrin repeat protein